MTHKLESVFPELAVFLPVQPPGMRLADAFVLDEKGDDVRARLGARSAEYACGEVLARFAQSVVTPPELFGVLAPLRAALRTMAEDLAPALRAVSAAVDDAASAQTLGPCAPDADQEKLRGFAVCDVYFRYRRAPAMPFAAFAGQTAATALQVVEDLPYAMTLGDDAVSLLAGLRAQLGMLARDFSAAPGPDLPDAAPAAEAAWPAPWRSDARLGRDASVAWWRLLVGHQHWNLLLFFAREAFDQTAAAFAAGDDESGAHLLRQAAVLFRATTACMWFSSAYPIALYHDVLRPTMVEGEAIDAQAQHLSYVLLKRAITSMKHALEERHGKSRATWPDLVFKSAREFAELYVQDMEQHIRVAASKVGMDSSLAQKVWQKDLPTDMRTKNAMELLRDMASMRVRDWR